MIQFRSTSLTFVAALGDNQLMRDQKNTLAKQVNDLEYKM